MIHVIQYGNTYSANNLSGILLTNWILFCFYTFSVFGIMIVATIHLNSPIPDKISSCEKVGNVLVK